MYTDIVKSKVEVVYKRFFKQLNIDPQTGKLPMPNRDKKFATYPYIGSKYGEPNHPKLLIVGLYRTKDEGEGHMGKRRIQSFEGRRQKIEVENHPDNHNHHMAGTYMTALFYLRKEDPEWTDYWEQLDAQKICQTLLKENELPSENPLSYIALTNYHKFVKPGGGKVNNKSFMNEELGELLVVKVEAFDPDIIVLQSNEFSKEPYRKTFNKIASERELYIGPSPSYVPVQKPRALIKSIKQYRPYPG